MSDDEKNKQGKKDLKKDLKEGAKKLKDKAREMARLKSFFLYPRSLLQTWATRAATLL